MKRKYFDVIRLRLGRTDLNYPQNSELKHADILKLKNEKKLTYVVDVSLSIAYEYLWNRRLSH
jgi:hypothetical protein